MQNKITDIQPQVNHDNRYSVYINEKFAFGISEFDLLRLSLKTGKILSDAELSEILSAIDESKCQEYANSLVCRKMYTEKELKRKLSAKNFPEEHISLVVSRLKEYGYINDLEYAKLYVEETRNKYGAYKIKQKLYEKGVEKDVIAACMADFESGDTAFAVLKLKLRGNAPLREEYQKYMRFLVQKGFPFDEAKDALHRYTEEVNGIDE